ncbi:hypothetical protein EAO71_20315 [Streptomyces sp. ms191]|uniref:hypothetical protein n=1 Tax=Streptomyces sp. ms191 TaxID=1827978 RepID=UPI0011CDECAA|nr:hypothetical protein [Streptomyces sp. ms191]TXS30740.1 hypothetical protein EAO71_20315 [Streptomyces sp. ms191]
MPTDPEAPTLELPPVPAFGHGRPRWAAQRIHPRRISVGHLKLYGRLRGWARAEQHPTRGKAIAARASGLALGALMTWRTANEQPRLLAIAAGAYAIAAWRAGRPIPPTEDELRRRVLLGVQELIGDRPGIHLRDLYTEFQARPAAAHLDDARLRAVLVHCGIPIHKSLRIGSQTGRSGIKAADIATLLSPAPVDAPSEPVDAGQPATEAAVDPA